MKYAITPDKRIHQVTDEKEFYENNPKAQDITALSNVHGAFEKQQDKETRELENDVLKFGDVM